ncbi:hypothetical protein NET03_02935 [Thermomicrobium sp. CFH 73360]|uniref:hypothetical protein n=1 Tax=Thermomicrobium sp. CFH 73360 TaxID=2951987 RepID=UPI0020769575|nr:hypothetical protein [Thermomicrobium sp. CFH 73360]MCM8745478.1 hypothetical protein [Thermomicrobium sp. CFH 73360]
MRPAFVYIEGVLDDHHVDPDVVDASYIRTHCGSYKRMSVDPDVVDAPGPTAVRLRRVVGTCGKITAVNILAQYL